MAHNNHYKQGQGYQGGRNDRDSSPKIDTSEIHLKEINADLFDRIAQQTATTIAGNKNSNKPTQLRRFYDEIVMWDQKISLVSNKLDKQQKFEEYLPFIRMINAKTAYAKGRSLVDQNYVNLLNHLLNQVDSPETLRIFKLFMEAFMGFYKQERPN